MTDPRPKGHEATVVLDDKMICVLCPCGWHASYMHSQLLALMVINYVGHLPPAWQHSWATLAPNTMALN